MPKKEKMLTKAQFPLLKLVFPYPKIQFLHVSNTPDPPAPALAMPLGADQAKPLLLGFMSSLILLRTNWLCKSLIKAISPLFTSPQKPYPALLW